MTRRLMNGRSRVFRKIGFDTSAHEHAHGTRTILYTRNGALSTTAGQDLTFPRGARVVSWWMNVEGAPSGGSFVCDATIDTVSIFEDGDLPTITTGNKEMDEVRIIGSTTNYVADSETLEIVPNTINGATGLQVWLEVEIGESDD